MIVGDLAHMHCECLCQFVSPVSSSHSQLLLFNAVYEAGGTALYGHIHSRVVRNLPDGTIDLKAWLSVHLLSFSFVLFVRCRRLNDRLTD